MILRVFNLESRRFLLRPRLWAVVAVFTVASLYSLLHIRHSEARVQGSITLIAGRWLRFVIPAIVGGVAAGSLAEDRRLRYLPSLLTRGVTRTEYFLGKSLAMAISSGAVTLLGVGLFYIMAMVFLPPGAWVREPHPNFPGPVPELFQSNPFLNDLLSVMMLAIAASVLALLGVLSGTLVSNEYVASALPFIFVYAGAFALQDFAATLNPLVYVDVWRAYPHIVPSGWRPFMAFIYWLVLGLGLELLSLLIFSLREVD